MERRVVGGTLHSGSDYRMGSKQPGPGVLKVKHTTANDVRFRCLHTLRDSETDREDT